MRTAASAGIDRSGYVAGSLVGRLTNAFFKKVENHAHSDAIHTMHYNFVRIYQMLRCAPTMAAGVTVRLRELADMTQVLEACEAAKDA